MSKSYTPSDQPTNSNLSSVPTVADSIQNDNMGDQCSLTQAGLEEYNNRTYYDQPVFHHQKQSSYAQSEGYHSYVSSSDSSSATPFLDRLRQESELLSRQSLHHWSQNNHTISITSNQTDNVGDNNSSEATSSTETLKWLGSMSDVSAASNTTSSSALFETASSPQRIVHSSKVHTPKRHNSESILYMNDDPMAVTNSPNDTATKVSTSLSSLTAVSTEQISNDSNPIAGNSRNSLETQFLNDTGSTFQHKTHLTPPELLQTKNHFDYHRQLSSSPSSSSQEQLSTASVLLESTSLTTINCDLRNKSEMNSTTTAYLSISCNGLANSEINNGNSNNNNTLANGRIDNTLKAQQVQITPTISTNSTTPPSNLSFNSNSSYRNNHRLFPISTYTEPVVKTASNNNGDYKITQYSKTAQQQIPTRLQSNHNFSSPNSTNCQSVADRINNLERQQSHLSSSTTNLRYHQHIMPPTSSIGSKQQHLHQQIEQNTLQTSSMAMPVDFNQKFSFIDPSKMHRVSNPTLKAFQKNAVQSYFERQQHQQQQLHLNTKENMNNNKNYITVGNLNRQQSLQPHYSPKETPTSHVRNSLPATFSIVSSTPQHHHHHMTQPLCPIPAHSQEILDNSNQQHLQQLRQQQQLLSPSAHINNDNSYNSTLTVGTNTNNPPPPPPRSRLLIPIRRSSSASDYGDVRDRFIQTKNKLIPNNSSLHNNNVTLQDVTNTGKSSFNDCGVPPPPPPPRNRSAMPMRRTSSASDYAKILQAKQTITTKELSGPMIMGPIISIDDWVPERPPKNPQLRIPSPDLPPPPIFTIETNSSPTTEISTTSSAITTEILQNQSQNSEQPPSPNRRNSFGGSPSRKAFYNALLLENMRPPSIPSKKPHNMDIIHPNRLESSLVQSNKTHKVILNGKLDNNSIKDYEAKHKTNDVRVSIRKRLHNNGGNLHQLVESTVDVGKKSGMQLPPPLKPRMSIALQENQGTSINMNNKLRCNSKASYLPRQSHDKLNTTDPVHGSYKLTLTSNEENINQNNSPSKQTIHPNQNNELLGTTKCKNLPDVLPVGAKLQHSTLPPLPTSTSLLSSNNSDNTAVTTTSNSSMYQSYPNMNMIITKPPLSQISPNSTTSFTSTNSSSPTLNLNRNSYSISNCTTNGVISPKFMSKSTIDLKKTNLGEAKEKFHKISDNIIGPAQSENNIIKDEKLNAFSTRREFQRTDVIRKLSLEELDPGEGQIVRAELVNTTLSTSPTISMTKSDEKLVYKRDSLRENIEKITQLQSQLMSSHFIENGSERKLLGYTAKTVKIESVAHIQSNNDSCSSLQSVDRKSSPIPDNIVLKKTPPLSDSPTSVSSQTHSETEVLSESENNNQKPIQRTEIIVRVNAPRTETASQTDEVLEYHSRSSSIQPSTLNSNESITNVKAPEHQVPSRKYSSEIDCDSLSKELANLLRSTQGNEQLCEILAPVAFKTSADYIFGLYDPCIEPRFSKRDIGTSMPCEINCDSDTNNSSNNVILHKSTNLRYENNGPVVINNIRESTADGESNQCDFRKKKEELINRLTQKLDILAKEQISITEEISNNDKLGSELTLKISEKVRSIEVTKFKAYVDDVGYITKLLLSLAGRLAKMDNNIHGNNRNTSDIKILETKRSQLAEQLEEAKRLKEDINRRGANVYKIIKTNLNDDDCADYDYFINMKAKLIVNVREITEKIKSCEEQLSVLKDTLVQIES